jgi:hypothetical protein
MLSGYNTSSDSLGPPSQGRAGPRRARSGGRLRKSTRKDETANSGCERTRYRGGRRCGSLALMAAALECSAPGIAQANGRLEAERVEIAAKLAGRIGGRQSSGRPERT